MTSVVTHKPTTTKNKLDEASKNLTSQQHNILTLAKSVFFKATCIEFVFGHGVAQKNRHHEISKGLALL
mgnify:CR=1 FL=1